MGNGMRQTKWVTFCSLALIFVAGLKVFSQQSEAQSYDLVLANGRVMDPESNFDAVRNVGMRCFTSSNELAPFASPKASHARLTGRVRNLVKNPPPAI